MTTPILEAKGLTKSFGGVRALTGVDFAIRPGEVHALVGENGAGKSTLVKILSGIEQADEGELFWQGARTELAAPVDAIHRGIRIIHQELELALPLSVAENIFLGALPANTAGFVDRKALEAKARAVLTSLGASFGPDTIVSSLRIGDRQVVEIAKAVVGSAKVIFMDEPTAALPPVEAERLMERVRSLKSHGVGVVYISHRLDEILDIADRITVLRDGKRIGEFERGVLDRDSLVQNITGRELASLQLAKHVPANDDVINIKGLNVPDILSDVSFRAAPGEIVGFFGLLGSGQSAIAEALFGLRKAEFEDCKILEFSEFPESPGAAVKQGIGYVPADRKSEGLAITISVANNLLLPNLKPMSRGGLLQRKTMKEAAQKLASLYRVKCSNIDQTVGSLSGGNQQKVVLAKWTGANSTALLLDEPTRGVDVGAKAEIYSLLREFSDGGGVVLVFSSDAEEVKAVCDRAYVLRRGRISAELPSHQLDASTLVQAAL